MGGLYRILCILYLCLVSSVERCASQFLATHKNWLWVSREYASLRLSVANVNCQYSSRLVLQRARILQTPTMGRWQLIDMQIDPPRACCCLVSCIQNRSVTEHGRRVMLYAGAVFYVRFRLNSERPPARPARKLRELTKRGRCAWNARRHHATPYNPHCRRLRRRAAWQAACSRGR